MTISYTSVEFSNLVERSRLCSSQALKILLGEDHPVLYQYASSMLYGRIYYSIFCRPTRHLPSTNSIEFINLLLPYYVFSFLGYFVFDEILK